ncbi:hypothetical protein DU504_11870 [Haloplanus salinus]|uniref:Uncharacterized protein n=1 Tax=Haloplanus salinus TaxID=1126245 RepID=A0A368NF20_9EURY|nr:hypothetical protein [Haloplanus salinus]RCU47929.1 hypothetical protein DU504_11870 [Haloplanus salinus]
MATDDYTMGQEVTEHLGMTVAEDRLRGLVARAKREMLAETNLDTIDFYRDSHAESALFWLTCIYVVGEQSSGGSGFAIGELEVDGASSDRDPLAVWRRRYNDRLNALSGTGGGYTIGGSARTDRDYSFEDSATY